MNKKKRKLNAAVFLLIDKEGRMLLQQRSFDTAVMPGYWAFFGGGIEPGETALQAVVREAREEIECLLADPKFVFEQDFILDNAEGHVRVYIEEFRGDKKVLKLKEGRDWGWFRSSETKALKMIPHDRIVIQEVEKFVKQSMSLVRQEKGDVCQSEC
jgi:8-oxo-dGTP diphosphatase